MLTRKLIIEKELVENAFVQRINETCEKRDESKAGFEEWEKACSEWHQSEHAVDYLWEDETRERLRNGNSDVVEDVLLFLEVDPWYFRSGYLKERLLDALRQVQLTERNQARIRKILLEVASGPNRREYRRYCALARTITNHDFERTLQEKSDKLDTKVSGKFSYMLRYILRQKNDHIKI